jgi:colanic acid biosynthesis glycosyl transferase WcaI
MHALILALNYYPDLLGNAPILVGIAEGLAARGHEVSVVCAFPHHETGRVDPRYRGRLTATEERNGVKIYRAYIREDTGGLKGKALNYASFSASSLWAALRHLRGVDVIFTPSPPLTLGLVDITLRRLWGAPYIYNVQDLFPEVAIKVGALTNPHAIRAFERMEREVLTRADAVAVICEGFKRHAERIGARADRVAVIPNFTDTDLITPRPTSPYRAEWGIAPHEVVLLFSGRMGHSQALDDVAAAWGLLRPRADALGLRLVMVGDGQAREEAERALSGDARVTFAPTQPRERLGDLLALANIGLAPLKAGLSGASVPSKILGLMAAGRAVVAQAEAGTDTALLVEGCGCGRVTPPGDAEALAAALESLARDPALRARMGEGGREAVVARFSERAVVGRYEALFLEVIARARAERRA